MKNWWHNLMHRLGLTAGYVDHARDANGVWWVGLRCPKCGRLMDPIRSKFQDAPPEVTDAISKNLKDLL